MTDKEIEAGIERACECDCAPPSTGWTVNPFPIIRDYIERLKSRAEVTERALLNLAYKIVIYIGTYTSDFSSIEVGKAKNYIELEIAAENVKNVELKQVEKELTEKGKK